ncbi:MAG: hypothetical protein A3F68_00200 [Acidobacteria bacterium RIFCSPLOWO2_12_FULL_54_10]|nr:MAG: hypothetical protein A3F68_00200 [Acidobacteria bacterium RIFCSPLOWO2_12_FULL_54_10]
MKAAVAGCDGPLAQETRAEMERRGHEFSENNLDTVIYFPHAQPEKLSELEKIIERGGFLRLVLRSHASAYGVHAKNPGMMTEERVSLLREDAPEQRWLKAEQIAAKFSNWAAMRLTNVLEADEGDRIVRQLAAKTAMAMPGRDPNVQFISLKDAARALAAAAESDATGIFNAGGEGAIPIKKAYRAAGTTRIPSLPSLLRFFRPGATGDVREFDWTVSGERAERELGFHPEQSSVEALADFLKMKAHAKPERLRPSYDDWGLDTEYIRAWETWFDFVRKTYWRIECEGMENIPAQGRALYVGNHRGFMPLDGVMHLYLIKEARERIIRFLIIPILLYPPYMSNFWTKFGCVIASQENAARLLKEENIVGILPEGIRGTFTPYKETYKLRDFAKSAFVQIAIENQAPIVPSVVVGHSEIFPIVGRIDSSYIKKITGWPYFPIAPPFPFLPVVPLPSKWHVRVMEAIPMNGFSPSDAQNARLVRDLSRHVQNIMQMNIDDMLRRRKRIFWGKVLDGTKPPTPAFHSAMRHG